MAEYLEWSPIICVASILNLLKHCLSFLDNKARKIKFALVGSASLFPLHCYHFVGMHFTCLPVTRTFLELQIKSYEDYLFIEKLSSGPCSIVKTFGSCPHVATSGGIFNWHNCTKVYLGIFKTERHLLETPMWNVLTWSRSI